MYLCEIKQIIKPQFMVKIYRIIALIFSISHIGIIATAQVSPRLPLDFEPFIAGNYGELRPNHFHAGLDFKTQQTIGHPVHAFADGYVDRIGINAYGYGLVVYLTHPGIQRMTVYGHLDTFSDAIWKKIRERQVAEELNNADIFFQPDEIPVKKGDVIALSGNTGSSGGPHVHFEVRGLMSSPGADDEEWYDPMEYFVNKIKDKTPPRISNLYIYYNPATAHTTKSQILNRTTEAWGKVGFGIKAYDYMDGTNNKYGVKRVKLFCDGKLIYNWNQEYFRYDEQRFTNSVIDYGEYIGLKSTIMKTYVEPGNKLRMIDNSIGNGIVDINEEREYKFRYELEDAHGNKAELNFVVNGKKLATKEYKTRGTLVKFGYPLSVNTAGFSINSPADNLYTDIDFTYSTDSIINGADLSPVFNVGSKLIPIHGYCDLSISIPDSITSGDKLFIANLDGGTYRCKYKVATILPFTDRVLPPAITARVREFGRFVARRDTATPTATIIGNPTIKSITISMNDEGSGVNSWKVYIDGKFVPFDMNNRERIVGHPENYGIKAGVQHSIEIHVFDLVGNESIIQEERVF